MQEICESHYNNSFISCCTIFSKNKQLLEPTQTCNIVFNNKQEILIFHGLQIKINIFVHFNEDKLEKFTKFLINSYSFVQRQSNNETEPSHEQEDLLISLIYNLQVYENDYYEYSVKEYNNLFKLEVLEKNVKFEDGYGMKLSLLFTNYFIANYFFNRFTKVINMDDIEYRILILPLDCEPQNPNLKRIQTTTLLSKEYISYQISQRISIYGNKINVININKTRYNNEFNDNIDKYYILFHPNTLIDSNYHKNRLGLLSHDTMDTLKYVKYNDNNYNVNWFVLGSCFETKSVIRCFNINHGSITQKIKVANDNTKYIKYEQSIEEKTNELIKLRKECNRKLQKERNDEINKNKEIKSILRCNKNSTLLSIVQKMNERKQEEEQQEVSKKRPLSNVPIVIVDKKRKLNNGDGKKMKKIENYFTSVKI